MLFSLHKQPSMLWALSLRTREKSFLQQGTYNPQPWKASRRFFYILISIPINWDTRDQIDFNKQIVVMISLNQRSLPFPDPQTEFIICSNSAVATDTFFKLFPFSKRLFSYSKSITSLFICPQVSPHGSDPEASTFRMRIISVTVSLQRGVFLALSIGEH